MATESFLVTALPRTADPTEAVHVSLFVTHRLTPDGAEGVVGDFPNVADWTARLAGASITLVGRTGGGAVVTIPVTADLSALDAATWPLVFPTELPVRPWQTRDTTAVPWRSFAAHRVQQHALLTHAVSLFSSPVAPPGVRTNALTSPVMNAIGLGQWARRLRVQDLFEPELDLDGMATAFLDDLSGGGIVGAGGASDSNPLTLLTTDVHRARRYYQRPEEARPYREQPNPDAQAVPVKRPEPDVHERASMLGDLSPLLRRLGLVIDLHVDDLSTLAGVVELQATLVIPNLSNPIASQPRVACQTIGTAFFATSSTGDYLGPLVRLGDEDRFAVLDLDPDASALKLEQYVRNVPRLMASEVNGDPVTGAPHAFRATGFALARIERASALRNRLDDAPARDAALVGGTAPPLHLEDVARGMRLEVWDDVSGEWHSLHRRRLDVEIDGAGTVIADAADTGFLQGAALSRADGPDGGVDGAPYHAHEVLAGWDGWSLSTPRPGNVVVNVDGREQVLPAPPADPDPINPVASTTRIEPLTLPRLRYGRTYAFRAWAVDLAGNSAPHPVAGPPVADAAPTRPDRDDDDRLRALAARSATARLAQLAGDATTVHARELSSRALVDLRTELRVVLPASEPGPRADRGAPGLDLTGVAPTGMDAVDELVRDRLAKRRERSGAPAPTRRRAIESLLGAHARSDASLVERVDARVDAAAYTSALVAAALADPPLAPSPAALIALLLELITTPRPFLRWEPVVEPAVVPRRPYTEAESLVNLVIRSGVEGPTSDGGLDLTIVEPEAYANATKAAHPALDLQWQEDSQRHLAPPKTSQLEAELFGRFDDAMGAAATPADVRAALALALRESGTFLDTTVADLTTPGARNPQPGVAFHSSPTAEAPSAPTPADHQRGDPLTRGQYVVHDVDDLVVPYLPDPFAAALTMVFPDAGRDHRLAGLLAIEGLTLRYRGDWPEPHPYRLVLESGDELHGEVDDEVIRVQLPPGTQLRLKLSSALERDKLRWLGLWRSLPDVLQAIDLLAEAAADGWFWWLTPGIEMRLVHAVPRPVEVPRPTMLVPIRTANDTAVALLGGVDVHGPSTERLDLEATWTEWVDDLTTAAPAQVTTKAAAAHTTVGYDEDLVIVGAADQDVPLPDGTALHVHGLVHQLGDTKHRDIDYRFRATTRYREYFDPRVLPTIDDVSVLGPMRRIGVPSTARPPKPIVHDVLPLFRWFTDAQPEQPFGQRRQRRSGLRLYLERPWYASGDGELLAVVLAFGSDVLTEDHVSQWGADPVYWQQGPAQRAALPLVDLVHLVGLDDRPEGGRPVGPARPLTLVDVTGRPAVWVLGYAPEFSPERGMWFVDVALDPGAAFWPFVRLAVARWQPSSLAGMHLSPVVRCDIVPLPPERAATVSRPDDRHARVVITGPVGVPAGLFPATTFLGLLAASRTMRVRLERRVPAIATDLGWDTVASQDLAVLGIDGTVVSWAGLVELPDAIAPRQPGDGSDWRITIEEWERLPADPVGASEALTTSARVVYADQFML